MQFEKGMAQTNKKRRRKRRGTQGGRVDPNPRRSRPRTRAEAKAQATAKRRPTGPKEDLPPTWRNSFLRGLFAAVVFAVLLILLFGRPVGVSLLFGLFMLVFYVPAGYYIDMTLWRRRERARIRARQQ
jgi:Flp pilus assembly protein TadB